MLQRVGASNDRTQLDRNIDDGRRLSLREALNALLSHSLVVLICIAVAVSLASAYVYYAKPVFTAQVDVLIETNLPKVFQFASPETIASLDTPQIESQIAIVKSERVAERIVDVLGLDKSPQETPAPPAPFTWERLLSLFTTNSQKPAATPLTPEEAAALRRRQAIAAVQGDIEVRRQGLSYSMQISYSADDPETAAIRANAVADAYIKDQIETRLRASEQGSRWLERRIEDLRLQMNAAALSVQQFKAKRDYRLKSGNTPATPGTAGDDDAPAMGNTTLEELEARAETYRKIFESYLAAYAESVQRQSYPVANARIITPATPPPYKSKPRTFMTLAASGIVGGLTGIGLALLFNALDTRFRTARQIREELGIECLGLVAMHDTRNSMVRHLLAAMPLTRGSNRRRGSFAGYHLSEVTDLPLSRFSRSIRNVRKFIDVTSRTRPFVTLGVTSALPGEGKSTFIANLATLYAMLGSKVLLVDADIVNATLSHVLAPDHKLGLFDLLEGRASLNDCIIAQGADKPALLPMSATARSLNATELLASKRLNTVIGELKSRYDIILFDLPPMRPVGDAIAVGATLDSIILAVHWSQTSSLVVADVVDDLRRSGIHPMGAVLTMALDHDTEIATSGY